MLLSSEIPPAERITSATQANNANKEPHTTTEQIEISEYWPYSADTQGGSTS